MGVPIFLVIINGAAALGLLLVYFVVTRPRWQERLLLDHLAFLARRNLPLQSGLLELAADVGGGCGRALRRLHEQIDAGHRLADAVAGWGRQLPPDLRNALVLGDRSGNLSAFLDETQRAQEVKDSARRAYEYYLLYPIVTIFLCGATAVAFAIFINPQFMKVFADLRVQPQLTMGDPFTLGMASFAVGLLALLFYGLMLTAAAPATSRISFLRPLTGPFRWILPGLRRLELESAMQQVAVTLGIFLRAGARLPDAVRAAADLDLNRRVKEELGRLAAHLDQGGSIASFVESRAVFPREFAWMVSLGAGSGNLAEQLLRAATIYAGRARTAGYTASRLMVPLFVLLNGFAVLGIATAILQTYRTLIGDETLW
jgi:general secretion pathway protein F